MQHLEAIADPIRARVVRHLEDRGDASLHELADAAGVHVNTIRPHLAALTRSGVLVAEPLRGHSVGRPPIRFRLPDDWLDPGSDLRGMAGLLAGALERSGASARDEAAEWGRMHVVQGEPAEELPRALAQIGFDAEVHDCTLHLNACPCRLVRHDRPEQICEIAIAAAEGVLAGCGGELEIGERTHDPDARRCSARLRPTTSRTRRTPA
jgi:predicted ArsR family transcriptional regulator